MAHLIASSPLSSPPATHSFSENATKPESIPQYRPTKQLPFELAHHVETYYEENLFTQAYNFLLSITNNSISSIDRTLPVTIPSPSQLALAATVSVHPNFTTRTIARDKWNQANSALRLLRVILKSAGPVNADLATAFTFRKYNPSSQRRARFGDHSEGEDEEPADRPKSSQDLRTTYANTQSLWKCGEDFWQLVGWAFSCACISGPIYEQRWNRYSELLSFVIEVLESDWAIRNKNNEAEESLLWQYIELAIGGQTRQRRILRAIFADGRSPSTNEFRAIFRNELKEPVAKDSGLKKREVDVNIDQEVYGDYLMQDDSDVSDEEGVDAGDPQRTSTRTRTRTPSSRRLTPKNSGGSLRSEYETGEDDINNSTSSIHQKNSSSSTLGDNQCLSLRIRLLVLLTEVSSHPTLMATSPTTFPDLEDLFTLFVEFIKPLPLPLFAYFVLPQSSLHHFPPAIHLTLLESLLQRTLETSAPSIRSHVLISQRKLEAEYLPFAAAKNSVDANARVAILLEGLTRRMSLMGMIETNTEGLGNAAKMGVDRRLSRAKDLRSMKASRNRDKDGLDEPWSWLVESGERLQLVVRGLG